MYRTVYTGLDLKWQAKVLALGFEIMLLSSLRTEKGIIFFFGI